IDGAVIIEATNNPIRFESGINGNAGTSIEKNGNDIMIIGAEATMNYKGKLILNNGTLKISAPQVLISTLIVNRNAMYLTADGSSHTTTVSSAAIYGTVEMGLYLDLITADIVIVDKTSIWNLVSYSQISIGDEIKLVEGAAMSGSFIENSYEFTENGKSIGYDVYTNDNSLYARITDIKGLGGGFSASFLANALTIGANNIISDLLYERMSSPNNNSVWLGFYGNGQNLGDFALSGGGAAIGIDFYASKTKIAGAYVRYGANNAKQEADNAAMTDIEFGLYGKTGLSKQFNLKGNLSASLQTYSAKSASDNFDFNTKSAKGGFEVEFVAPAKSINIKPFIGLRSGFASNDKIKINDNQEIAADNYIRVETVAGIGIDGKLGIAKNFSWYGKLYGKYLAAGTKPEYKINDIEVEGTIEPEMQGALTLGAEIKLSKPASLFINGGINFGSDLMGYSGGAGINYRF
ncbi:MAG: autotransporter outer membrane beta-barrel domain-containing protein, partial [Elusimicrobiota bacterium]|nr:autotransporter outer membrane beta-barrel domain-containing protein [Elusimicrobiota bacterium]